MDLTDRAHPLRKVDALLHVLNRNFGDLERFISECNDTDSIVALMSNPDKLSHVDVALREVARLLHNHLGSMVSCTQCLGRVLEESYPSTQFLTEFQKQKEAQISKNEFYDFIRELRNYATHHYLPLGTASVGYSGTPSSPLMAGFGFHLEKTELLRTYGWGRARVYLAAQPDQINVAVFAGKAWRHVYNYLCWPRPYIQQPVT